MSKCFRGIFQNYLQFKEFLKRRWAYRAYGFKIVSISNIFNNKTNITNQKIKNHNKISKSLF